MGGLNNDRGQMLLIGGVLLAVVILSLAMVFNGALYTSILAGEGTDDVSGRDVLSFQNDARSAVNRMVARAIDAHPASPSDAAQYVKNRLAGTDGLLEKYYGHTGRIVSISQANPFSHQGEYIFQNNGPFVFDVDNDGTAESNWNLGTDVRMRKFSLVVTSVSGSADPQLRLVEGSNTYVITVTDSDTIEVETPTRTSTCSVSSTPMTIDVTGAEVNGNHCNALDFFERIHPERIDQVRFVNGGNAQGSYDITVFPNGQGSNTEPQLYAVRVTIAYRSMNLAYENTLWIAPGEPQ